MATNQQPIGPRVSLTQPPPRPSRVTLTGKTVTVAPLTPDHAAALYEIVQGDSNAHLFTYLPDSPYASLSAFEEAVVAKSRSEDTLFFVIVDNTTARPVGWISLHRIDASNRVVEVGNVLFSPRLQRTRAATEVMYLLARYVFEDLHYRRYEWKCDNLNAPSKRAAIRLGFSFEGIFRKHMVYKQRSRDTCWLAMTDEDWANEHGVKHGFEGWLSDDNFDAEGRQRRRLEDFRKELKSQKGPVLLEL